jgi:hypothetical protein
MKRGAAWLANTWTSERAPDVAQAYRIALGREAPAGRLVLADLARYCHALESTFVAGDPHATALNEGRRDVLNHVLELIDIRAEDFAQLIQEVSNA